LLKGITFVLSLHPPFIIILPGFNQTKLAILETGIGGPNLLPFDSFSPNFPKGLNSLTLRGKNLHWKGKPEG